MRIGHKYVDDPAAGTAIDSDAAGYAATMGYEPRRFQSAEEFIAAHDARWVRELHAVLAELLERDRVVLGLGSGEGEHEVLLHRDGFDVIATDVVPGVLDEAARLFPSLRTQTFDAFGPWPVACDDVLATGLEFYFDDERLLELMRIVKQRLAADGRFLLVLRYRDNLATHAIDGLALPLVAALKRRRGARMVKKQHGYRRSISDVRALAARAGFRVGRVRYAAFAMEFERLLPAPRPLVALDRRLHVLNSATVFELLPER